MHGFPDIRTVKYIAREHKNPHRNSRVVKCYNKLKGSETKMRQYLSPNCMDRWSDDYCSTIREASELDHYRRRHIR